MEPRVSMIGQTEEERREIQRHLARRAAELAMIHGRAGDHPNREDLQQAKREVMPLKLRNNCLLYTSPSPRDRQKSRMPSSA